VKLFPTYLSFFGDLAATNLLVAAEQQIPRAMVLPFEMTTLNWSLYSTVTGRVLTGRDCCTLC
jgi:hypothetical protein